MERKIRDECKQLNEMIEAQDNESLQLETQRLISIKENRHSAIGEELHLLDNLAIDEDDVITALSKFDDI